MSTINDPDEMEVLPPGRIDPAPEDEAERRERYWRGMLASHNGSARSD